MMLMETLSLNFSSSYWHATVSCLAPPTTSRCRAWPWGPNVPPPTPICTCGGWERELFDMANSIPLLSKVTSWYRYIDDILLLWSGPRDELTLFIDHLTQNSYNLKFTMECSQSQIHFLDLQISLHSNGQIQTALYRKPSSGNTILHASSAHPKPLIPFSQYLRLTRNCTLEGDFLQASQELYSRLIDRGYSHSLLKKSL